MPRKASHDIASRIRGAFIRACASLEDDGRPLSTILEEMLIKDPKGALDTVSKFVPKEMLVETTIVQQLDELSDEALEGEIRRLAGQSAAILTAVGSEESVKH